MTPTQRNSHSLLARRASALWAAAFLFFLLYSDPHRVHHFFEQARKHSHDHSQDHHHHDSNPRGQPPSDSDCVFQTAANGCQLGITAPVQLFLRPLWLADLSIPIDSAQRQVFLPWLFHIRAPPQV